MIYLDYSATTAVSANVLAAFSQAAACCGNANSAHRAGQQAKELIDRADARLRFLLGLSDHEPVYTSGATEANNLAIRGSFERGQSSGKTHFITTRWEHPSVIAAISALCSRGASVDFVPTDSEGIVDMDALLGLIRPETLLVSIGCVSSELGIRQPIEAIGKRLRQEAPEVLFHSDMTQALGKIPVDVTAADMASFSAHKFFGIKGSGALIKRKSLLLQPQIRGGASTSPFRSGTPPTELIVAMVAALEDALKDLEKKVGYVKELNSFLRQELRQRGFIINSSDKAIPHILNVSFVALPSDELARQLSDMDICISTRTACSGGGDISQAVLALTGSRKRARSSIRISLSHLTTWGETAAFLSACDAILPKEEPL